MIKFNNYPQVLPLYLKQQNSYLKQVKIISFFNYGYIKLWAKFNTYASKKKYFSKIRKFHFYRINSFNKIKKKLNSEKFKFFAVKRKRLGLLFLYRSFNKPNFQIYSYNYYKNCYSSAVIFKNRGNFLKKKYKY
jgi:hypothetical protein